MLNFSAVVAAADRDAVNAALEEAGFGPSNFTVWCGASDASAMHVGLHCWDSSLLDEIETLKATYPSIKTMEGAGSVNFTDMLTAESLEWVQPEGAHDTYMAGDQVVIDGRTWESLIDYNVWEPGTSGWREVVSEGYPLTCGRRPHILKGGRSYELPSLYPRGCLGGWSRWNDRSLAHLCADRSRRCVHSDPQDQKIGVRGLAVEPFAGEQKAVPHRRRHRDAAPQRRMQHVPELHAGAGGERAFHRIPRDRRAVPICRAGGRGQARAVGGHANPERERLDRIGHPAGFPTVSRGRPDGGHRRRMAGQDHPD